MASGLVQSFLYRSWHSVVGHVLSPKNCPSPWGIYTPSNTLFPGPTRVLNPNSVLIGSAIFAGLTTVTDRPTNRPRYHYLVCNNRPHYFLAKNHLTYVSSAGLAFSVHIQVQSKRCYNDAWVYCLHYLPVLYSCWCAFLINIPVLYIGWSDVTVICDHVTICILWGNCVILCQAKWWRFVTLFKQNWISWFKKMSVLSLYY